MVSALKTAFKGKKTNWEGIKAPLVQTTPKFSDVKKFVAAGKVKGMKCHTK